jgi:hypothetical protein
MTDREKQLEAIVRELYPAARDILWCALVWNDHNFRHTDLFNKALSAAKSLGYDRYGRGADEPVNKVNAWIDRVDRVLGDTPNG